MKKLDKFSLDSRKRKKKRKKKVTNFNLMVLEINQTKTNIIELLRIKNRRMISCLLSLSYPLFVLSIYYIGDENIANLMVYTKKSGVSHVAVRRIRSKVQSSSIR